MTTPYHRKFISVIAGVSILLTGFAAAPARADSDDVGRALAAIVGLAIVGAAIKDARDDRKAKPVVRHKQNGWQGRYIEAQPLPKRVNRKLLPQRCFRTFSNRRGNAVPAFGYRCLSNNYPFINSLPRQCLREAYGQRGVRTVFGARCLRKQGYQLARR